MPCSVEGRREKTEKVRARANRRIGQAVRHAPQKERGLNGETLPPKKNSLYMAGHEAQQRRAPIPRVKHTLHFPEAGAPGEMVQLDSLHVVRSGRRGPARILVAVDVATRYCAGRPLAGGTAKAALDAFRRIKADFARVGVKIDMVTVDNGAEFKGAFQQNAGVKIRRNDPERHTGSALVERWNRTIAERLYDAIEAEGSSKWADILPHVVQWLNDKPRRVLGGASAMEAVKAGGMAGLENAGAHRIEPMTAAETRPWPPGTQIRIALYRRGVLPRIGVRATDPKWSAAVYQIADHRPATATEPLTYLVEKDGARVRGFFYASEIKRA